MKILCVCVCLTRSPCEFPSMICQLCFNGWCLQVGKGKLKSNWSFTLQFVTTNWFVRVSLCATVCMETQEAMSYFASHVASYRCLKGWFPERTFGMMIRLRLASPSFSACLWGSSFLSPPVAHRQPHQLTQWYTKKINRQLFCWYANRSCYAGTKSNCSFPITVINWNFLACLVNSNLIEFCHRDMHILNAGWKNTQIFWLFGWTRQLTKLCLDTT